MIHHNYEIETGIQAFSTFKEKNLLPDAFVCVNDNTAVGVCLAAKEAGYSIPGDFLVTGFDNEDKASYYEPRITTVGFSKADIMENALLMLEKIWNGNAEETYIYAPFTYVFQESCGCVSQNPPDRGEYVIKRIVACLLYTSGIEYPASLAARQTPTAVLSLTQTKASGSRFFSLNVENAWIPVSIS